MHRYFIIPVAVLFAAVSLVLTGCGDPEQKGPVNEADDEPLGLGGLFEDADGPSKPVADADVDIVWEEYLTYGRKDTELTWPQALVKLDSGLYLIGTRADGEIVKRNTVEKKNCYLVFYKLSDSGVSEIASFPSRYWERLSIGITDDGNRIYLMGGAYTPPVIDLIPEGEFAFSELSGIIGDVDVFDPATGELTPYSNLPVPKSGVSALYDNGRLYACGGFYDTSKAGDELNASFHYYDKGTERWMQLSDLKRPAFKPLTCIIGTQFYLFGGRNIRPEFVGRVALRYDIEVFVWQKREPLPEPREGGFAFPIGDKIYIMGGIEQLGYDQPDTPNLKIHQYDTEDDSYTLLSTPLPESGEYVAFDGYFFYLAGRDKVYRGKLVKE